MTKKSTLIASVLLIVALLSACSPSLATGLASTESAVYAKSASSPDVASADETATRTISVTGTGKVDLVPDIAYISIGVHTQNKDISEAVTSNNSATKKMKEALVKLGVADKDIQTSNFSIYPQQQYDKEGQMTDVVIYSVDNNVMVTVRKLDQIGQLLGEAVKAGANSINNIQFDVDNKSQAQAEARKAAVDDARKQAEELAKAAGVTVGEIQSISVYTAEVPMYSMYSGRGSFETAAASNVPISAGQMTVTVTVNATYLIK
jgi:uncharacterized protein YggE